MKGTVFAVALNHQSQRDARAEAFEKPPTTPAKNRGVVYQTTQHGDPRR